jgi:hypothetical protein
MSPAFVTATGFTCVAHLYRNKYSSCKQPVFAAGEITNKFGVSIKAVNAKITNSSKILLGRCS